MFNGSLFYAVLGVVIVIISPPAAADSYTAIPVPGADSIWLFDSTTGSLARCEAADLNKAPVCSPWSMAPGPNAQYRWDPKTQKIIPMNEAARHSDQQRKKAP